MGVGGAEFGGVLDEDQAFARGGQDSRHDRIVVLPEPVPPVTRNATRAATRRPRRCGAGGGYGAGGHQLVQGERAASWEAQGQRRAGRGDRGQHGVQAYAAGQAGVGVRGGVVQASAGHGGQALGQAAYGGLVGEAYGGQAKALAGVDPHLAGAVDQDVRDVRVAQQRVQRAGAHQVGAYLVGEGQHLRVAEDSALRAEGRGHVRRGRGGAGADQPRAYGVGQVAGGVHLDHRRLERVSSKWAATLCAAARATPVSVRRARTASVRSVEEVPSITALWSGR